MISIKNKKEIENLGKGGKILAEILNNLKKSVKEGICTKDLDILADNLAKRYNVVPSFKNYSSGDIPPFPAALCVSINEEIVHGIPLKNRIIKKGDLVSLDMGIVYNDLYTDSALTTVVGEVSDDVKKLVEVTKEALNIGIRNSLPLNYVHDIGKAMQIYIENNGFSVIRELFGHGVGFEVHEPPLIPNYYASHLPKVKLKPGMVIAIEPMVSMGSREIEILPDGWTAKTKDNSLSAHFEHTIAITDKGPIILTKR
jgi:methionyl aminopeptidase